MYDRKINGKTYTFGVSGLLYRSNVLMYDHQTESLWLQVKRRAVTGPMTGTRLTALPSTITSWKKWWEEHPDTTVLSFRTGHRRNYSRDPYEDYYQERQGWFRSFFKAGPNEVEKEIVAGLEIDGLAKAFPIESLRKRKKIIDTIGNQTVTLTHDDRTDRITVKTGTGENIEPIVVYWFVWKGIHPETERYNVQ